MTILKAPKNFKGFGIGTWWGCAIEPNAEQELYLQYEQDFEPLTDESLQALIKEAKEFYDDLINLRDALK